MNLFAFRWIRVRWLFIQSNHLVYGELRCEHYLNKVYGFQFSGRGRLMLMRRILINNKKRHILGFCYHFRMMFFMMLSMRRVQRVFGKGSEFLYMTKFWRPEAYWWETVHVTRLLASGLFIFEWVMELWGLSWVLSRHVQVFNMFRKLKETWFRWVS